jgi:glucan phosphoethanolaminetransferase (alkaline phosphatase superfamily)
VKEARSFRRVRRIFLAFFVVGGAFAILVAVFTNPPYYGNSAGPATSISTNAASSDLMDQVHLTSLLVASYLLPLGFIAIAWMANRRSPKLASVGGALSVLGLVQTSLYAGQDSLYYDIARSGGSSQIVKLIESWNSDPIMSFYSIAFGFGSTIGPALLGIALWRSRLTPSWASALLIIGRLSALSYPVFQNDYHTATLVIFAGIVLFFISSIPIAFSLLAFPFENSQQALV